MTGAGTVDLGTKMLTFRVEPKLVMTTEGQGRTSDPVGLGIPVVLEGPWAQPRIYPEMSGILDNPDAAYAKLKEMGKGLFGANGGGLGGLLGNLGGNLGGLTGNNPPGPGTSNGNDADANGQGSLLGGRLGETLGNMIQQGLGGSGRSRSRSIPPIGGTPDAQAAQPQPAAPPPTEAQGDNRSQPPSQDSQPMNDVLRQLFNRSQN